MMRVWLFIGVSIIISTVEGVVSYTLLHKEHNNSNRYCLLYGDGGVHTDSLKHLAQLHVSLIINTLHANHSDERIDFLIELPKSIVAQYLYTSTTPFVKVPDHYTTLLEYWKKKYDTNVDQQIQLIAADKRPLDSMLMWGQLREIIRVLGTIKEMNITEYHLVRLMKGRLGEIARVLHTIQNMNGDQFQMTEKFEQLEQFFSTIPSEPLSYQQLTIKRYLEHLEQCRQKMVTWHHKAVPEVALLCENILHTYEQGLIAAHNILHAHDPSLVLGQVIVEDLKNASTIDEALEHYSKFEKIFTTKLDLTVAHGGFLKEIYKRCSSTNLMFFGGNRHKRMLDKSLRHLGWQEVVAEYLDDRNENSFNVSVFKVLLRLLYSTMPGDYVDRFVGMVGEQIQTSEQQEEQSAAPSSTQELSDDNTPACYACGILSSSEKSIKLKYCARCGVATYCSRECQKQDWSRHKKECQQPQQP